MPNHKSPYRFLAGMFFIFGSFPLASHADIKLPQILSDHLVLQREADAKLWGWADDGEQISVYLDDKKIAQTQTKQGNWHLSFKSPAAGGPYTLEFRGKNTVTLNDVYFGDVWVASGQSNMQTPMSRVAPRYPNDIIDADYPQIREFEVPRVFKFDAPTEDFDKGDWQLTTPATVLKHSAAAYYFSRSLHQTEGVPVGIISANFGGSASECWMSLDALKKYPELYKEAVSYGDAEYLNSIKDGDNRAINDWIAMVNSSDKGLNEKKQWFEPGYNHSQWQTMKLPGAWADQGIDLKSGVVWFRRTLELTKAQAQITSVQSSLLRLGTIVDADNVYVNGEEVGNTGYQYPPRRYKVAPGILKAGENVITLRVRADGNGGKFVPETPYYLEINSEKIDLTGDWRYKIGTITEPQPARHFIPWNEPLGCYNAMMTPLFNLTIKGVIWYQGESNTELPDQYAEMFPELIKLWRDNWGQGNFPFLFVQLPNYMAAQPEPIESGWADLRFAQYKTVKTVPNTAMVVTIDSGEWNDLHPRNKRAVGERLAMAARALAYKHHVVYSGPLFKKAKARKNTVVLTFDHIGSGLMVKGNGELQGFAVAGKDGKFFWAKAKIEKGTVIVWSPDVPKPEKLRYAWADNPDTANLYNEEGLPASPFEVTLQ